MTYKELKEKMLQHYSFDSTKKLMTGKFKPSYERILMFNRLYGIPFDAWLDIRAWLKGFRLKVNKNSELDTICPNCGQVVTDLAQKLNEKIKDM